MDVCLFGTYQRDHSANRLLREALTAAGCEVEEIHEPLWERTRDKDAAYFAPGSLAALAVRWARCARRLRRRFAARTGPPPVVVVGFGGQLDLLLAARVCRPRRGLVFAPLVSLTETLVDDRRLFGPRSLRGRLIGAIDRRTLATPDLVLADTAAHAAYFAAHGARAERVAVWYLGVEPEFVELRERRAAGGRVLYYGSFLPLHGVRTIIDAASKLGTHGEVVMLGSGPERAAAEAYARERGVGILWRDPVPLGRLPEEIAAADVVLGVFGASEKAAMVIPNKVWQAAAMGAPIVTRDGPAVREVLRPGRDCLVCPPADADALARVVRRLLANPEEAARLGRAARAHVLEHYGPSRQAQALARVLAERFETVSGMAARHG
jgi:glycosyltransferase involved in cell wall biosynthesis